MTVTPTPAQLGARFYAANDLRLEQVPVPSLAPGEVRVKVAYVGICGSDLHEYFGGPFTCRAEGCPHPLTGETVPCVLGHEFSGTVEALGEGCDAERLPIGAKVCIDPVISCLECRSCRRGDRALCAKHMGHFGYNRAGGLQRLVNLTEANLHVVPDSVPLDVAALAEPLSVAWHAVKISEFKKGDSVLVMGAGPIGALVARVLKSRGVGQLIISEPNATRSSFAKRNGADLIVDPLTQDIVTEVRKATGGEGVDIAIDCAGLQASFDAACEATRAKGKIVMVALWKKRATVDLQKLLLGEKILTASACFTHEDMEEVVAALASGLIKVDDLITSTIELKDLIEKGFFALRDDAEHHIKIVVDLQKLDE